MVNQRAWLDGLQTLPLQTLLGYAFITLAFRNLREGRYSIYEPFTLLSFTQQPMEWSVDQHIHEVRKEYQ